MRKTFDKELDLLNEKLTELGEQCVEGIDMAIDMLFNEMPRNDENIKKIHEIEKETDRMESDIETLCLNLIVRQQPVARDLKIISAALKMISDMERIGDQVADIADISKNFGDRPLTDRTHIKSLSGEARYMVVSSIEAFVKKDIALAEEVVKRDEIVDELFVKFKGELLKIIYQDIHEGELALDLLMVAKYFERLADHATNIAEWVEYAYKPLGE